MKLTCISILFCVLCTLNVCGACQDRNINLYWANQNNIYQSNNTEYWNGKKLFDRENSNLLISAAYDQSKNTFFYTENEVPHRINMYNVVSQSKSYIENANEEFEEIALDSITSNLYYISHGSNIGIYNQHKKNCTRLIETPSNRRTHYRNLIIHPESGIMFWINGKVSGLVSMSTMDGKYIRRINYPHIVHSMALDAHDSLLYLAEHSSLIKINLVTKRREKMDDIQVSHLFHFDCKLLAVHRCGTHGEFNLYHSNGQIKQSHWLDSTSLSTIVELFDEKKLRKNPCDLLECPSFCVLNGQGSNDYNENGRKLWEPMAKCL